MAKYKKNNESKEVQYKPIIDTKRITIIGSERGTLRTGRKYTLPTKLAMIFINKGFATLYEEKTN
jgi:hypothetical protein